MEFEHPTGKDTPTVGEPQLSDWRSSPSFSNGSGPRLVVDNSSKKRGLGQSVVDWAKKHGGPIVDFIGTTTRQIFNAVGKHIGVQYSDGTFYRIVKSGGETTLIPFTLINGGKQ